MLIYDNVEQLVSDIFHTLEVDEDVVSVVADKELVSSIMQETLTYKNVSIDYCNIDSFAYDREYFISLSYDDDDECWYICVDPAYNGNKEKYNDMGGYVLFHEDVNSKALIDIQNNEMSFLTGHDWFVIGEDDSFETDDEEYDDVEQDVTNEEADVAEKEDVTSKSVSCSKSIFTVNGKKVDQQTYNKVLDEFDNMYLYTFSKMLNPNRVRIIDFVNGYPMWMWN